MSAFMAGLKQREDALVEAGKQYANMDMQQLLVEQKAIFEGAQTSPQAPGQQDAVARPQDKTHASDNRT